ncbi:type IV CRISPR-associated protein Csf2 [Hydrogenophaga bisanensis]|uniref:Type IV CRISPR-associated protein Csf2 n=1 Tax=Hydrogenophaga bisanensis TaxID=439611 RepID=A0ABW2RD45_9BURK
MSKQFPGRFILAADITLTSPMNIAAAEKGRYVFDGGRPRIVRYDGGPSSPGLQCTLTRTHRVMVDVGVSESDDGDRAAGQTGVDLPVIPASSITGKLRNLAAGLVFESFKERGLQITTDVFNMMTTGSATNDINASDATAQIVMLARKDAFLSNFGGTSFMLSSNAVISTGWPLVQLTRGMLMSPELLPTEALPDLKWTRQMTSALAIVRKDTVREMRSPYLTEVIAMDDLVSFAQAKAAEAESTKASKAAQRAAKAAGEFVEADKKRDLRTLSSIETVNTGMSFALRVRVNAATPAQLGLMVLAFQRMLQEGQIGGKVSRGLGQFICNASRIIEVDPRTNRPLDNGSPLFLSRDEGYEVAGISDDQSSALVQAVMAGKDYLHEVAPKTLQAYSDAVTDYLKKLYEEEQEAA